MEIIGEITLIIYRNETNSYTVAEFESDEELITIVGYLPFINEGDSLKIIGKYIEHKEYGRQFKIETFEKLMPLTLASLERYLGNGNIRGVGEALAKRIIDKFGEETIDIIRNEPKKLALIKGITDARAGEISEEFIAKWEVWQIVGFLEKFGLGAEYAKKVFDLYGINAIEEIESNPYKLIDIARGVDFKQIDLMALKMGIEETNLKRIQSGIKYALIRSTLNGHSCVLESVLTDFVVDMLDISSSKIEEGLCDLEQKKEVCIEKQEDDIYVYMASYYLTELEISNRIKRLQSAKNMKHIKNINEEIKKIEIETNVDLSEKQEEAIIALNENNVMIITGGPGTGKTTVIKTIIDIYEKRDMKVTLCAPTGRAAKRMFETTGRDASTLHRLLEIGKIDEDTFHTKTDDFEGAPIDADVIIVDEVSMVDMFLIKYLLKCVYQGTKLVLVGDKDQLSSVGPGAVLKDFIESEEIKVIHLDKVFRQAATSKIILNAHRVNKGEKFTNIKDEEQELKEDFFYIKDGSKEQMLSQILSLSSGRLKSYGDYDFFRNIQVLSPTKKGLLGTRELNVALQQSLNPPSPKKLEVNRLGVIFRVGDRVMQIKNNYDINWEKVENKKQELGSGIFNGEIGTILNIHEKEKEVEIKFDDEKIAFYPFTELDQIEHSYAITIHKAQGSEFDVVILVAPSTAPMLLTRNLLYTGITRAKKMIVLIGSENIVNYMIDNVDSKKRNTGLKFKLQN